MLAGKTARRISATVNLFHANPRERTPRDSENKNQVGTHPFRIKRAQRVRNKGGSSSCVTDQYKRVLLSTRGSVARVKAGLEIGIQITGDLERTTGGNKRP